ncbi:MAG: 4'-phosphopantetheinyl transferase superfamily protein [Beijerinckiaceae bacterium]|nr:4'-phosphopantetheinyl transferase superfamily protein [Beijerinckiaceae bacterium]
MAAASRAGGPTIAFASLADRPALPAVFIADLDTPSHGSACPDMNWPEPSKAESGAAARLPPGDAGHFLLRRRICRSLVAHYTGLDAAAIVITADIHGAPTIEPRSLGLHVSFAHRGGWSAFGIAHDPIGVDLEKTEPSVAIPWAMLHEHEAEVLRTVAEAERGAAFLRLWTMKEAYVKALGRGFRIAPDSFAIDGFLSDAAQTVSGPNGEAVGIVSRAGNIPGGEGLTVAAAILLSATASRG